VIHIIKKLHLGVCGVLFSLTARRDQMIDSNSNLLTLILVALILLHSTKADGFTDEDTGITFPQTYNNANITLCGSFAKPITIIEQYNKTINTTNSNGDPIQIVKQFSRFVNTFYTLAVSCLYNYTTSNDIVYYYWTKFNSTVDMKFIEISVAREMWKKYPNMMQAGDLVTYKQLFHHLLTGGSSYSIIVANGKIFQGQEIMVDFTNSTTTLGVSLNSVKLYTTTSFKLISFISLLTMSIPFMYNPVYF
jgi:hypothetical protein